MAGLPKSIIKEYGITKKAWRVFRGRSKSRSRRTKTTRNPIRRIRRKLARRYRRKRRVSKGSLLVTLFKFVRLASVAYPAVKRGTDVWNAEQNAGRALTEGLGAMAGFQDGVFEIGRLFNNWTPYIATSAITYGVQKLNGIIRRL